MKLVGQIVLALLVLATCFIVGSFFIEQGAAYITSGQLTYGRKGQTPIVVSPEVHAFSFYYQVAFWLSAGLFFVLLAASMCLYAAAKATRSSGRASAEPIAAAIYRAATFIAYGSIASSGIWFLLRLFRSALIQ